MFTPLSAARRTAVGFGVALATAGVGVVAFPMVAQAHVEVEPAQVEGGDFAVVAFRVPNERDDASTTKLRVILPKERPLGSVQTTAMPGWTVVTANRRLSKPIEMSGAKLDSVVAEVTWTATQGGLRPGQFEDFQVSLGELPASGELVFTAIQTYSDGRQVRWNEVSQDPSTEPEHPAPTLRITPPGTGSSPATGQTGATSSTQDVAAPRTTAAPPATEDSTPVLPTVLSAAALVVAFGAVGLAWRRTRDGSP